MWLARVYFKLPAYFWRKQRPPVNEQEANASQARHGCAVTLVGIEPDSRGTTNTADRDMDKIRQRIAALKQKGSEIRPVLSGFAFDPDKPLRIKQPYQQPRGGDY